MDTNAIVKVAMFEALDQAKRDELISDAIEHLLKNEDRKYGGGPEPGSSPLALRFKIEVSAVAQEWVRDWLKGDTPEAKAVRERIQKLLATCWMKVLEESDPVADAMAKTLSAAFDKAARDISY